MPEDQYDFAQQIRNTINCDPELLDLIAQDPFIVQIVEEPDLCLRVVHRALLQAVQRFPKTVNKN